MWYQEITVSFMDILAGNALPKWENIWQTSNQVFCTKKKKKKKERHDILQNIIVIKKKKKRKAVEMF